MLIGLAVWKWPNLVSPGPTPQTNKLAEVVLGQTNSPNPVAGKTNHLADANLPQPPTNRLVITNIPSAPTQQVTVVTDTSPSDPPAVTPQPEPIPQPIENPETEPHAVTLLNKFLEALKIGDEKERLQAVLPLFHRSLVTPDGQGLRQQVRDYSFKAAVESVASYEVPVKITRVDRVPGNRQTSISLDGDEGDSFRYYISRLPSLGGTGTVLIFFPADGGMPKITALSLM